MRLTALLTLLCISAAASAELYTWTDAEGHKHFGDKPPADGKANAQQIEEKKAYAPGTDAKVKEVYQRTNRMFDAKDQVQHEAQEKQKKQAATRAEDMKKDCHDARDRARRLSGPVVFVDDSGKEVKTTDADRKQRLQETQEWITANCN